MMAEHDDDDLDHASMRSMRAVWLSMRDEEPSSSGMSGLLAAAREQAEQMRARPTWSQRVLAGLRRPPALAFATVVILVGGAVVVTRNTDEPPASIADGRMAAPAQLRMADERTVPLEVPPPPQATATRAPAPAATPKPKRTTSRSPSRYDRAAGEDVGAAAVS
ncbi:MAG TPA: hypothetical protein VK427_04240, partial [Kofleriaceae bacterium]|nr:hypothetical protein [Kofleriaceae bacterium]